MEDHNRLVDNIDTGQSRNETRKIVLHLFSLFTVLEPLKRTCISFEDQIVRIQLDRSYTMKTLLTYCNLRWQSIQGWAVMVAKWSVFSPSTLTILLKSAVLCFVKLCEKNENKLKRQET